MKKGKGVPLSLFRCPVCQSADRVKRERGESPRQTRCCELFYAFHDILHPLFRRAKREGHETRVSQKTCL